MGAWQCAPTSLQTMRKGAEPQAMVITEVRVVLARCKDNVFFLGRQENNILIRMPDKVVQSVLRDFSVSQ